MSNNRIIFNLPKTAATIVTVGLPDIKRSRGPVEVTDISDRRLYELALTGYTGQGDRVASLSLLERAEKTRSIELWEQLMDVFQKNPEIAITLTKRLEKIDLRFLVNYFQDEFDGSEVIEGLFESKRLVYGLTHLNDINISLRPINESAHWLRVAMHLANSCDNEMARQVIGSFLSYRFCFESPAGQDLSELEWLRLISASGLRDPSSLLDQLVKKGGIRALADIARTLVKRLKKGDAFALKALYSIQHIPYFSKVLARHWPSNADRFDESAKKDPLIAKISLELNDEYL